MALLPGFAKQIMMKRFIAALADYACYITEHLRRSLKTGRCQYPDLQIARRRMPEISIGRPLDAAAAKRVMRTKLDIPSPA